MTEAPPGTSLEPRAVDASRRRRLGRAGAPDLKGTDGFLVTDARGRLVGRVEGPMYGSSETTPDALSVRFSVLRWRRRLVPAAAIDAIDDRAKVIGLRVDREAIRAFL